MRNVLITGASRGIGAAAARLFAKNGYRVFINYNKSVKEAETLSRETGGICVHADISSVSEIKNMMETVNCYGSVDVLINNAGVSQDKMVCDVTEQDWNLVFDTDLKGMFFVTQAVLPGMIHNKRGKIINVSSMWGVTGGACEVVYSAAKAGVIGFTRALAKEVGTSGINVNCIAPGVIMTDMCAAYDDKTLEELREQTPIYRLGTPEDVAGVMLFLASDSASFITGQVINTDGGFVI